MKVLRSILGKSVHLQIILLYYNDRNFFTNITGLTEKTGKSHVTVRKVVADLLKVNILKETDIGTSRVIRLDEDGPYTKALIEFLDKIKNIENDMRFKTLIKDRRLK
ncbi:MAG TPA: hypothetical protein ENG09_03915 [Candidatus Syntrophoarchaeum butanivorans]|uniref:MarR family transcriptional regulator n=1 Tax=Candidatus Syntropharchaeum butanivorans TaxID=1839936 RepID=A0A1F2P4U9_9EURY|nr:MAG: hypothetical protein SBU_000687 [Candidatus Syntrophoarchaeum butanivorans]HDM36385.1 hypothetical protein [Candidatus Syntrophoarchaeum butanivorans]HEC57190.1 hypothetical protein [Candidatus Syntrophoarchaeum butanivorans]